MNADDIQHLRVVAEDLDYLSREWGGTVREDELRRASTVLRRLLVNGDLQRAWNLLGPTTRITIIAADLTRLLGRTAVSQVDFASAGCADVEAGMIAGFCVSTGGNPEDPAPPFSTEAEFLAARARPFRFREFLESPCIIAKGVVISRSELVEYVANRLGGAHFDSRRRADEEAYRGLDGVLGAYRSMDRDPVFTELLAIGQSLAKSPDCQRIVRVVGGSASR